MKKTIMIIAIGVAMFSCEKDTVTPSTDNCPDGTPTYTANVKQILDNSCATSGCHNGSTRAAGLDYSTYAATKSNATKSNFLGSIRHQSGFSKMPLGGAKLSDSMIKTLECWVSGGLVE